MQRINIPESKPPRVYWPENLQKDNYTGELEIHEGVCSLVIPKPSASNKDVAKDLKLLSQQFEHKADMEGKE